MNLELGNHEIAALFTKRKEFVMQIVRCRITLSPSLSLEKDEQHQHNEQSPPSSPFYCFPYSVQVVVNSIFSCFGFSVVRGYYCLICLMSLPLKSCC